MNNSSVTDLSKIWLDMMRLITQHINDENCDQWHPTLSYSKIISDIEKTNSEKVQINIIEVIIMLFNKKKIKDLKERKLFRKNCRRRTRRKFFEEMAKRIYQIRCAITKANEQYDQEKQLLI